MSGRCGGLHCPGCGDGGGARLIALVAAAAIAAAVIRAIWHTLIEAAEIAAIVIAGAAGAAAAAGAGYAAVRIRRLVLQARQDRRRGPAGLEGSRKPAIEPAREYRIRLHGLTPGQIAAIAARRGACLEEDHPRDGASDP